MIVRPLGPEYDIDGRETSVNDGKGTTTYTCDGTDSLGRTEHRGLVTGENVGMGSNPSTFAAAYDSDGNLISESYPAGVVATSHYDNNGNLTNLTYASGSTTIAQFNQTGNAFGEIRTQSGPESSQTFTYDSAARLTKVADTGDGTCLTRVYAFDLDSNRTKLSTYPAATDGTCSTTTTPTATTWSHDAADRTTNSGYTYDAMGRTLKIRGADTSLGTGTLTLSYFANDMIHSENDGTTTDTFALDPTARLFSMTNSGTAKTTTRIYAGPGDSPAWLSVSDGSWSRNVTDIAGNLAAIQTGTGAGSATLQVVNPHGDVVATLTDPSTGSASMTAYFESTEFGVQRVADSTHPANYGWLGGKRRDSGDLAGLVLMGARVYDPYVGRFTSFDPVPGGSANNYDYCNQDPVNGLDLGGTQNLADGGSPGGPPPEHHHHHGGIIGAFTHAVSHAASDVYHGPGHVIHDIHNDVIKPINRDLIQPARRPWGTILNVALVAGLAITGGEGLFAGYELVELYRAEDTGAALLKTAEAYARPGWRREIGGIGGLLTYAGVHGPWARHHL